MTVTIIAVATVKFLVGMQDYMVGSDAGMGNLLLVPGIMHMCGCTFFLSHMSPGMDWYHAIKITLHQTNFFKQRKKLNSPSSC